MKEAKTSLTFRKAGFILLIRNSGGAHLQLEFIGNQRDKLRVGGLVPRVCVGNNSTNTKKPATFLGIEKAT